MDFPALGIAMPTIDPVGARNDARSQLLQQQGAELQQQKANLELLASGAAYALDQGIDGPVNEAKWNEVLDSYEAAGLPRDKMEQLRASPHIAPILVRASHDALSAWNDAEQQPLKMKLLAAQIEEAMANANKKAAPGDAYRVLTPDEAKQLGLPDGVTYQINDADKKITAVGGGSSNGITITNEDGSTTQIGGPAAKGPVAYDVDENKRLSKLSGEIADEGRKAATSKGTLTMMKQLLSNDQVYTGIGAAQVQALKRAAVALGLADAESVQDTESFNALARQSSLDVMGGSLGTGFSNADRDFVIEQVPNLGNTKEGNLKLIDIQTKIAQRKQDIAKFAAGYKKDHDGRLDAGFEDALASWAEQNPLFAEGAPGTTGGAPAADHPGMPKVGDIQDGYRFKGGDPGDKANWERVQ